MKTVTVGYRGAPATMRSSSAPQPTVDINRALRSVMLCAALGFGALSLPALAEYRIIVRDAPPPLQVEELPVSWHGPVWAPGYWRWHHHRHRWVRGHWIRERHGHQYESARWEQRGNRYHFAPARWQRDPNRSERDPMRSGQRHGEQR